MNHHLPAILIALSLGMQCTAKAQQNEKLYFHSPAIDASPPGSRLRQLESIYQQQLRTRHVPLLSKYLIDLQQSARVTDSPALQEEIQRVQTLISAGAVIDLTAASRELSPQATPATADAAKTSATAPPRQKRALLTLTPSLSQSILPQPEGSASPVAALIGTLSWRIESLPAGEYDLVLHYASVTPDAEVPVFIELAGQKLSTTAQPTKTEKTYHLLRLGQIQLAQDISGIPLTLTAASVTAPGLHVRTLVLSRSKKAN